MKEKIFQQLKQKYANLGLAEEVLQSVAESLNATGIVTDENLETVIAGQGAMLKSYQSSLDKLRTEGANWKKELEELKSKGDGQKTQHGEEGEDGIPEWFKKYQAGQDEKLKALMEANEKAKAEKAKAERENLVMSSAKEAGIPEWRIKEGFAIPEDMDEKGISEYMSGIKQNIVTNSLEGKRGNAILPGGEATKEDVQAVIAGMRI